LNALRDAGLITTEKRGRKVYARVVPLRLEETARYFAAPVTGCACDNAREAVA
jgi:DNA-binding transcriptional ArsR family regulator